MATSSITPQEIVNMSPKEVIEHNYSRRFERTRKAVITAMFLTLGGGAVVTESFDKYSSQHSQFSNEPAVLEYTQTIKYLEELKQFRDHLGLYLPTKIAAPQGIEPGLDAILSDDRAKIEALDTLIQKAQSYEKEIETNPKFKAYQEWKEQKQSILNKMGYGAFASFFVSMFGGIYYMDKQKKQRDSDLKTTS